MIDPPRPEVSEAVEQALGAGIRIIMVTGDYGLTAEAIARRIGIVRGDRHVRVITGVDLEAMTDDDLKAELDKSQDVIFARVAPEHKMVVVSALKELDRSSPSPATASTTRRPSRRPTSASRWVSPAPTSRARRRS